MMMDVEVLCFFFQAEDGIRDRNVTGVQTCALPIFGTLYTGNRMSSTVFKRVLLKLSGEALAAGQGFGVSVNRVHEIAAEIGEVYELRSEERRVGKECRSRAGGAV